MTVTDTDRLNFLSNSIQNLVKEKKEPDLDLKISNPEIKDIIILFQKRSAADCPPIKLTFYNTTTKKNEEIEFYNYFQHLQKFGFVWEYSQLDFRYSIELSKDQKKLIRKMTTSKIARKQLSMDGSRIWNLEEPAGGAASTMSTNIRSILLGYMWTDIHVEHILNICGNSKNLDTVGINEKIFLERLVGTSVIRLDKIIFIATKYNIGHFYTQFCQVKYSFMKIKLDVLSYVNSTMIKEILIFLNFFPTWENMGQIIHVVNFHKLEENCTSIKKPSCIIN